ncbi:MAG TPA: cytochrome P450 [Solirubrobacteraceae bacterium]|jgi:cytochrome P450|nr:cytochrome P450 [Solirubrobacteraceae bacterium]
MARSALPPGPRMPSALQAVAWARRPLPFLERCRRRYGDVFTLRVRNAGTWVILADPEDVRTVFTADHATLGVGIANSILGPLLGPRSVMLLEEPEHVRRRRLMLPPFHGERMQGYGEMMAELTRRELRSWPRGEPFELWPHMQEITLESIMRVVFGGVDTDRLRSLHERVRALTNWMNDPRRLTLLAAAGPRWLAGNTGYREVMEPVEQAVLEEVRDRQAHADSDEREDIASMLAGARYEDGAPMTEQDLRDELVTLLTDGPTSALLCWAFERLLRHPAKLARLRTEVHSGQGDEYLDAVVKETLRLCPAAPLVVRRVLEPMTLGGHPIPAGTTVAPSVHLVHRREDIYPQPQRFLPERFLDRAAGAYTWIPFGGGVRRCLAAPYAQMLMKNVIGTVVGELDLQPVDRRSERPEKSAITFVPHMHGLVIATGAPHTPCAPPKPGNSACGDRTGDGSADYALRSPHG